MEDNFFKNWHKMPDPNFMNRHEYFELIELAEVASSLLKNHTPRRVRARGLQVSLENRVLCRHGALTGRVFQQAAR
jgi:hypothetical protein